METKWLSDFLSLCDTGSFMLSAEERHISPSAFGRRIKSLEEWVGRDLIDRSQHPVKLTAAGTYFKEKAEQMLSLAQETKDELGRIWSSQKIDYTIALGSDVSEVTALSWMKKVSKQLDNASTTIKLFNAKEDQLLDSLNESKIDFYVGLRLEKDGPITSSPGLKCSILSNDTFIPVCRPELLPIDKTCDMDYMIESIPYLSSGQDSKIEISIVEEKFRSRNGIKWPRRTFEIEEVSRRKKLVLDGFGFAWLSYSDIANEINTGRLSIVGEESDKIEASIISYQRIEADDISKKAFKTIKN